MAGHHIFKRTGLITSVEFKSCSEIPPRDPLLVISLHVARRRVHSESSEPSELKCEFAVPVDFLKTPSECERWIGKRLRSLRLHRIVAETGNPKVLLRDLIWMMKKKSEAGEVYMAVVEVGVYYGVVDIQAEIFGRRRETWVNDVRKKFYVWARRAVVALALCVCVSVFGCYRRGSRCGVAGMSLFWELGAKLK